MESNQMARTARIERSTKESSVLNTSVHISTNSTYKGKYTFETNRGDNPVKTMCENKNFILKKIKELT